MSNLPALLDSVDGCDDLNLGIKSPTLRTRLVHSLSDLKKSKYKTLITNQCDHCGSNLHVTTKCAKCILCDSTEHNSLLCSLICKRKLCRSKGLVHLSITCPNDVLCFICRKRCKHLVDECPKECRGPCNKAIRHARGTCKLLNS